MTARQLEKVSINELISMASYSIEQTKVPAYNEIVENFSNVWADIYLDEDLKDQEGEPCFIIRDDCNNRIRGIVVADELDEKAKMIIINIMDNVIFDLTYYDALEQVTGDGILDGACGLKFNDSCEALLNYIDTNEQAMSNISKGNYSWLQVLANGRLDLVTL